MRKRERERFFANIVSLYNICLIKESLPITNNDFFPFIFSNFDIWISRSSRKPIQKSKSLKFMSNFALKLIIINQNLYFYLLRPW